MKTIIYSRQAAKVLRGLPTNIAARIESKIKQYATDPTYQANNVKAMQGDEFKGCLRLRVGDWRVIFSESGKVIDVRKIASRGSVY